jgi:hypothetical protein
MGSVTTSPGFLPRARAIRSSRLASSPSTLTRILSLASELPCGARRSAGRAWRGRRRSLRAGDPGLSRGPCSSLSLHEFTLGRRCVGGAGLGPLPLSSGRALVSNGPRHAEFREVTFGLHGSIGEEHYCGTRQHPEPYPTASRQGPPAERRPSRHHPSRGRAGARRFDQLVRAPRAARSPDRAARQAAADPSERNRVLVGEKRGMDPAAKVRGRVRVGATLPSRGDHMPRLPESMSLRHARSCPGISGGRCRCTPTYQAQPWSQRDHRRLTRTFPPSPRPRAGATTPSPACATGRCARRAASRSGKLPRSGSRRRNAASSVTAPATLTSPRRSEATNRRSGRASCRPSARRSSATSGARMCSAWSTG